MAQNRKHDWATIQKYYDEGHSLRSVTEQFGCSNLTIQRARDAGLFKPREKNALKSASSAARKAITCACGSPKKSLRSKFCSNACYAKQFRKDYITRWEQGLENGSDDTLELKRFLKKHMLEQAEYKCLHCSFAGVNPSSGKSILQVDHIDGDSSNNQKSNLRVLCPNCHAMTPTYGMLNRGNGKLSKRISYERSRAKLLG